MHKIGSKTDCQLGATAQLLGSPIVYPLFRQYICRSQGNKEPTDDAPTSEDYRMWPIVVYMLCTPVLDQCVEYPDLILMVMVLLLYKTEVR